MLHGGLGLSLMRGYGVAAVSSTARSRMVWMDFLRGVAIFLVVCWHSAAILVLEGQTVPDWLMIANDMFAPFRIPMLMFLSGMLLDRALQKPLWTYYEGKLRNIAWPWVVWTLVHFAVMGTYASITQHGLWLFSYLWFLVYLLVFYAVAPPLRRIPTWLLVVAPYVVGLTTQEEHVRRFFFLAVFFFLGKWASEHAGLMRRVAESRWTLLLTPVVVGYAVVFATVGPWRYQLPHIPMSFLGIVLAVALVWHMRPGRLMGVWSFVGRNSIVYYASHFPVIVLAVRVGIELGWSATLSVAVGLVLALAVGTGFAISRDTPLGWLFAFPKIRRPAAVQRPAAREVAPSAATSGEGSAPADLQTQPAAAAVR